MDRQEDIGTHIRELAFMPDSRVELARGALLVARSEYPQLDQDAYLRRLDDLAERVKPRIGSLSDHVGVVAAMNRVLFEEEGFQGNSTEYYDPRNSFLNEVLDRKLGIPITLSIVYIEVGRRAGLRMYGVGLPGHFITGLLTDAGRVFIDPFNRGKILTEDSCRRLVTSYVGAGVGFDVSFLDPVWPKQILVRLMRNLKAIYWSMNLDLKALQMIEWILTLDPQSAVEVRERGFVNEALGDANSAVRDLEKYLDLVPDAQDREAIVTAIARLKTGKATIH